ncbi:adenylyl cyclase X E-like isoform X5 [Drosophila pseudoobscura]|uniref:adenylate cyclase n=1 Tax=Drosophila pseudoobscura pseudoobscura TaxID=46245 RepID=A0A6I8VWJ5_DROPS|nr:adenylyl cyclase X E isoform X5 [Drosophila pseudoobscura]
MPRQSFVDDVCQYNYTKERLWERSYLLVKCAELHLEEEYRLYQARLWNSFLGVFLLLHTLITIAHCALLLFACEHPHIVYIDVALYIVSAFIILTVLSVNFCENLAMRHSWITYTSAVVSSFALVSADIFQGTYHYYKHDWALDTFYDTYIIYMIYMFMPIPIMSGALLLGVTVSVVYISYFWVYVAEEYYSDEDYGRFSVDIFHHVCFNLLGMFFRVMNDIVVRSSFLDRHQYIMEKIWLRNARRQEKLVLHSIIPPQIAKPIQDDIQNRLARKVRGLAASRSPGVMEHVMAIQIHPEVSILYADVVNYTKMTTTLNVEKLVRLLHDLYGRFDMAATQFEVQRIKFLGDCYYCVAGLMRPSPDHAKNCVGLGLSMISHIQEVRREHDVDINMRIGVHSGSVIAGVIGEAKLQYDIWGTDVTIANHLESTGSPGFVHVSASTLNELEPSEYTIIPGTDAALEDPVLSKHNISTFLISTEPSPHSTKRTTQRFESLSHMDIPARPDLYRTKDHVINEELRHEFRKMPVSSFNWRMDLRRKQRDAHSTNYSIIILLNNILPAHVVNVYLTSLAKHELYYEEYKIVSVMFATLKNFELSLRSLRLLNEIITEFDRLLHHYKDNYTVEKIKIVGCTYMAACGLDVNFAGRISKDLENRVTYRDSLMEEVEQAQIVRRASSKIAEENTEVLHEEVVFVMTTFALDLMRTLWMLNKVYETVSYDKSVISPDMSIGISSGEVMAGIVGASHPHYDIWGHPVNMASRMDSTGMIGHIQVTKETAILLGEFGIMCNFRGQTYVKGTGNIPTYFVAIDDDYEFIATGDKRTPKRSNRERDVSMSDNESIYNPFWHDDDDEIDDN